MDEVVFCEYCGKPVQEDYNFILDHTAGFYGEHALKDKDPTIVREGVFCSRSCLTSWLQKPKADKLSCRNCKYDTEMDGNPICTLKSSLVMEFAKEHLGFPDDFKILNNWFMGLEPCDYWVAKEDVSKAYGAVKKEALEKLDEICVDMWERTPAHKQFTRILLELRAIGKITPWDTYDSPFATNQSCIRCLPFAEYKRLRKLQLDLKTFLDSAKQCFDEIFYSPPKVGGDYIKLEQEEEAEC